MDLIHMRIIIGQEAVDEYLTEHELEEGSLPIDAVLMQREGTASGQPAFMIAIDVDGKKVLAKTTLRLMESAVRAMRAASGVSADGEPTQ